MAEKTPERVLAAAMLHCQGDTEESIGERLGVSQPTVSRWLTEARAENLLTDAVRFDAVSAEMQARARALIKPHPLKDKLLKRFRQSSLREVFVFDSRGTGCTPADFSVRLESFGRAAVSRLAELLWDASTVGVTWGITLARVFESLRTAYKTPPREVNPIEFVPLAGDPLGYANVEFSSTRLASMLNDIVNGGNGRKHSLAGVPAFIPVCLNQTGELEAIEKMIRCIPSYAKVFAPRHISTTARHAPQRYLTDDLDIVLTSAGSRDHPLGWDDELLKTCGSSCRELAELIMGDVGGVLLARPGRDEPVRNQSRYWTGLTLDHLRSASHVVLAAIGSNKAEIVTEAIRQRTVHELWIDEDLAGAIH